jgi:hypothetical protein
MVNCYIFFLCKIPTLNTSKEFSARGANALTYYNHMTVQCSNLQKFQKRSSLPIPNIGGKIKREIKTILFDKRTSLSLPHSGAIEVNHEPLGGVEGLGPIL